MPYPTKESLPDAVKDNLPSEAQEIWRNAFNSAAKQFPGDEEKANKIAWDAIKTAGWTKDGEKWVKNSRDQDYSVWTSMKARCSNENDKDYARYGGRGIAVCERWRNSFEDFMKDMGVRSEGYTIERLNNDGNYEPKNCKWVDRATQAKNRNHALLHEFDAEVFSIGTWNGDNYSEADLDDMVKNFDLLKNEIKPPVKLGHNEKQTQDGQPALGWVSKVKRVGSKLIATLSSVPDIVHKALQSGRYKRVSSEIYWNYKSGESTFKRVLAGVALLGADIPAVTNLEDLEAFLSQSTDKGSFDKIAAYSFDVDEAGNISDKEEIMSEEMRRKYEAEIKVEKDLKEVAEKEARDYKAELDTIKKADAEKARKTEAENLKSFCETMVEAGKMTPAGRDIILEDGKHAYTEDGKIIIDAERFQKYVETHGKVLDLSEVGGKGKKEDKNYSTANEELAGKAQKYSVEKKCDYSTAIQAVLAEDKDLADRYISETEKMKEE